MNTSGTVVAAKRLRLAIDARVRAEVEEATAIAEFAAANEWTSGDEYDVIGTRPVRIGADGTPLYDEFVALEVAALKGISVTAATWLIRDLINLKYRHPLLWGQAMRGALPVFRACQLAAEAARYDLSSDQAGDLDAELAPHAGRLPWPRLMKLCRGLIATLAADRVTENARRARQARFVRKLETEDPTVGYLSARVDTADAIFFDAMVDRIADILATRGDSDTKDFRRAKAIGILATPARAQLMLAEALGGGGAVKSTDPRLLPQTRVFVHVAEETLMHGNGTCRIEDVGALSASMLALLVGHSRIKLTPVVRPFADVAVDSYEIPSRIRAQVILRDIVEVFPFSNRATRKQDLDHTDPYRPDGPPGQTRASNLGPLSRRPHRAKTHGDWRLEQPRPGTFWWTSPAGNCYRVTPNGTRPINDTSPLRKRINEYLWKSDHEDERDKS